MSEYSSLKRDLIFGVCSLCFTIFFGVSSIFTISPEGSDGISGQTFPFIITFILLSISIIFIYSTIKNLNTIPKDERVYIKSVQNYEAIRIIKFILSLVLYVFCFIYIGFIISTAIFLAYMMYFMHAPNKKIAGAIVVIAPLILWYFFTKLMEVSFPAALLF